MPPSLEERGGRLSQLHRTFLSQLPALARGALGAFEAAWTADGGLHDDQEALSRLHMLAGILATFGHLKMFEDLRRLEYLLLQTEAPSTAEMLRGQRIAASIRAQVEALTRQPV